MKIISLPGMVRLKSEIGKTITFYCAGRSDMKKKILQTSLTPFIKHDMKYGCSSSA